MQKAMAFLNAHREEDVYRIMIGATSASTWEISYPTEQKLINELKGMRNMSFTVEISITRCFSCLAHAEFFHVSLFPKASLMLPYKLPIVIISFNFFYLFI